MHPSYFSCVDTGYKGIKKMNYEHTQLALSWYEKHKMTAPNKHLLSDLGYMVDGRVAGWLYVTNSGIAMIENIISDPDSVPSLRRESLDKLVGFMVDVALSLGYTTIVGLTKHPQIFKLGNKFGFQEMKEYKLMVLSAEE